MNTRVSKCRDGGHCVGYTPSELREAQLSECSAHSCDGGSTCGRCRSCRSHDSLDTGHRVAMSLSEAQDRIGRIDLEILKLKLCDSKEGPGWTIALFEDVEREYRRFLIMYLVYPDRSMAPSKEVDEMWHYHILDTRKYAADCAEHIGFFFHHFPYLGLRGEGDEQNLRDAGNATLDTYVELFGEEPRADIWWSRHMPSCGGQVRCGKNEVAGGDGDYSPCSHNCSYCNNSTNANSTPVLARAGSCGGLRSCGEQGCKH